MSSGTAGAHGKGVPDAPGGSGSRRRVFTYIVPGIAAALYAVAGRVPVAGYAAMLILICGLMYLAAVRGVGAGLLGAALAVSVFIASRGAVYGAVGAPALAAFILEIAGAGYVAGIAVRAGAGALRSLAAGVAVPAVLFVLLAADAGGIRRGYEEQIDEIRMLYEETGAEAGIVMPGDGREALDTAFDTARLLFPAAGLAGSAMTLFLAYVLFAAFGRRTGAMIPVPPPFGLWRLPFWPVWVLVAALAGALWADGPVRDFALNVLAVSGCAFLANGAAVFWYKAAQRGLPAGFVFLLYALSFAALPVSAVGLALAGLFDIWFDFRKLTVDNTLNGVGT